MICPNEKDPLHKKLKGNSLPYVATIIAMSLAALGVPAVANAARSMCDSDLNDTAERVLGVSKGIYSDTIRSDDGTSSVVACIVPLLPKVAVLDRTVNMRVIEGYGGGIICFGSGLAKAEHAVVTTCTSITNKPTINPNLSPRAKVFVQDTTVYSRDGIRPLDIAVKDHPFIGTHLTLTLPEIQTPSLVCDKKRRLRALPFGRPVASVGFRLELVFDDSVDYLDFTLSTPVFKNKGTKRVNCVVDPRATIAYNAGDVDFSVLKPGMPRPELDLYP